MSAIENVAGENRQNRLGVQLLAPEEVFR